MEHLHDLALPPRLERIRQIEDRDGRLMADMRRHVREEVVGDNIGKWRHGLSNRDIERFEAIAGETLDRFSYELVFRGDARRVSALERLYWRGASHCARLTLASYWADNWYKLKLWGRTALMLRRRWARAIPLDYPHTSRGAARDPQRRHSASRRRILKPRRHLCRRSRFQRTVPSTSFLSPAAHCRTLIRPRAPVLTNERVSICNSVRGLVQWGNVILAGVAGGWTTTMQRLAIAMSLVLLVGACSGGPPAAGPTSPTAPQAPQPTYTLSGVIVTETPTGLAPVEGVWVQVNMIKPAMTDGNGFYSIPGLTLTGLAPNVAIGHFNTVTAWKPSYVNDTRTLTISGDTRHDIQFIRRATFTLSGVVSEKTPTGLAPIEGVEIHDWSCDPVFPGNRLPVPSDGCSYGLSHSTTTDKNGRYSIPRVYASKNLVCATKDGYQGNMPGSECGGYSTSVTVDGDTRFDFQLVRH